MRETERKRWQKETETGRAVVGVGRGVRQSGSQADRQKEREFSRQQTDKKKRTAKSRTSGSSLTTVLKVKVRFKAIHKSTVMPTVNAIA